MFVPDASLASELQGKMFVGEETLPSGYPQKEIDRNVQAVKGYDLDKRSCSLVIVSNSGYALTNRHCLGNFLAINEALIKK